MGLNIDSCEIEIPHKNPIRYNILITLENNIWQAEEKALKSFRAYRKPK